VLPTPIVSRVTEAVQVAPDRITVSPIFGSTREVSKVRVKNSITQSYGIFRSTEARARRNRDLAWFDQQLRALQRGCG
jgi:hypothetical protein